MIAKDYVLLPCPFDGCELVTQGILSVVSDHEVVTGRNEPFAIVRVDTDALYYHVLEAHPC